jgi:hypothetical protein
VVGLFIGALALLLGYLALEVWRLTRAPEEQH